MGLTSSDVIDTACGNVISIAMRHKIFKCICLKRGYIVCGVGILLYKILLDALGGQGTLLDSASTTISVFANLLMMLRYREQWLLWIIIDIITVIMWILAKDLIMVTMWSVYLINAFYGSW